MAETLVSFPHGLVGCERWTRFALLESPDEPVHQLVCLNEPGIGLLVCDACLVAPDFALRLSESDERLLEPAGPEDLRVLCTLTLHDEPPMVTANLLGPLVINRVRGVGKQVVLVGSGYSLRHPVIDRLPEQMHAHSY